MRVLGISGSPRSGGNTEILIKLALEQMAQDGFETDFLPLAGKNIKPCVACGGCAKSEKVECVLPDPGFEGVVERFMAADAAIVGSPAYFGSATPHRES
jgi:multimeric flavodoxin WrbA